MKDMVKKQLKSLGITQAAFCKEHGFDNSNFAKTYNRFERNFEELKDFLDKLELCIEIKKKI